MSTTIILGTFQQAELNDCQMKHFGNLLNKNKQLVVLLVDFPAKYTRRHPLNYLQRKRMIKKHFPSIAIEKVSYEKFEEDTNHQIDHYVRHYALDGITTLLAESEYVKSIYTGNLEVHVDEDLYCGLEDKKVINQNELFREGIIHATQNQYPIIFPTVDIAVLRNNNEEVLLGRKPDEYKWRFPGGFVDGTDQSFEEAALRELKEECGNIHVSELSYIGSFRVVDWRYQHEEEKIFTTLYCCQYESGETHASDDLSELKWVDIQSLSKKMDDMLVEDHHALLQKLIYRLD